jgi:hypothetical protein
MEFLIDYADGSLGGSKPLTPDETARMYKFLDDLDEADRKFLEKKLDELKLAVIYDGSLEEVPDEWADNLDRSGFVPLVEVFPLINAFKFQDEGHRYEAIDYYCMKEGCDCRVVRLGVVRVPNKALNADWKPMFSVRYNLNDGSYQLDEPGDAAKVARVFPCILRKYPDLRLLLLRRYQRVRQLMMVKPPKIAVSNSRPVVKPPKCGRNDPCPCGSGNKFKKCCGA